MNEIKYSLLNSERPGFAKDYSLWRMLTAHRDNDVPFLRNYLLKKRSWESTEEYDDRLTAFTYTPLMSSFVSNMTASMSSSPFVVSTKAPSVEYISENTDTKGKASSEFIANIYNDLMYYGRCYTVLDIQDGRPYLLKLNPMNVIDEGQDWYRVRQLITTREPLGDVTTVVRFTIFTNEYSAVYESPVLMKDNEVAAVIVNGKTVSLDKAVLPLVALDNHGIRNACIVQTVPAEHYLGRLLVDKQNQYSRIETAWTLSGMVAGQVIRMFTPVERSDNDPRRLDTPNYDNAKLSSQRVLVGSNFMFAESTGTAIQNLTSQLEKIEQQMREITSQRMTGTANAAVSGVSKGIDAEELNTTMRSHGAIVRKYWENILNRVALLTGYSEDVTVSGFNDFELSQRDKLLETSIKVGGFAPFLPNTVQKLWWQKVSKALVGTVSTEMLNVIETEIEDIFSGETQETDEENEL